MHESLSLSLSLSLSQKTRKAEGKAMGVCTETLFTIYSETSLPPPPPPHPPPPHPLSENKKGQREKQRVCGRRPLSPFVPRLIDRVARAA